MAKLIQVNGNLEVKKADVIVKSRYKLNPLPLKFITTLITGLKRSDDINEEYVFKVKDFQELTNLKRKDLYWAVKEALKELLEKPLYIPTDDGFIMCNWISGGHYVENQGEVRFMIYPKLRPYLLEAQKRFLKYKLENILSLKSSYSIRMYEILKDWFETYNRYKNKTEKIISLDELRQTLEISNGYRYYDIKKRILEKAKLELAKHTDIIFDYEEIKTGRKVTHLKFRIKENYKNCDKELKKLDFKSFVALLRKNYSGNQKFWGVKEIDGKTYWLGLDNNGLVYGWNENECKDFNADEAKEIYLRIYKVIKKNKEVFEFIKKGVDLYQAYMSKFSTSNDIKVKYENNNNSYILG